MVRRGVANITIVATGGTRAPTQLDLAERFVSDGHDVRCIATRNALRFLTSHMARRPRKVSFYLGMFRPELLETFAYYVETPKSVPHIAEGKWGDVFVMCPASCNSVGKLASGIGDNYALQVLRAVPREKRVIVVPSMNPEMWFDPQFQRNVDLLNATEKYRVVCPSRGMMLSGDMGFGAQAPFEEIVAETYRALGLLDPSVAAVLAGYSVPWSDGAGADGSRELVDVVLVDGDGAVRTELAHQLERQQTRFRVHQFSRPGELFNWLEDDNTPALVFTELSFAEGASGLDVIERLRRPGGDNSVQIIATSTRDRREAGAERLARQDVLYLPKPINVSFAVGMIGGCVSAGRRHAPMSRRRLEAGEVLFREGDKGTELYVVESGRLRVFRHDGDREVELASLGERELVGEMAFLGNARRTATVVAEVDTDVIVVDIENANEYLLRQPAWVRARLETLARRLGDMNERAVAASATTG
jgi:CheY-like chemotaxis protein